MKQRIKKKWLKALRSGTYVQGKGRLLTVTEDGDEFCCLGVLCELHAQETGNKWTTPNFWNGRLGYLAPTDGFGYYEYSNLPHEVADWAGIERYSDIDDNGEQSKLMELNDNGKNFNKIADWIENNL